MKSLWVIGLVLLFAKAAWAGVVGVPELDPGSLATGLGLAVGIVLVLSGRR